MVKVLDRPSRPYDDHINKTMAEIDRLQSMSREDIRGFLSDAWMDGLKYGLVMIESEKRNRDPKEA